MWENSNKRAYVCELLLGNLYISDAVDIVNWTFKILKSSRLLILFERSYLKLKFN